MEGLKFVLCCHLLSDLVLQHPHPKMLCKCYRQCHSHRKCRCKCKCNLLLWFIYLFCHLNFKPIQYVRTEFHSLPFLCDILTACQSEWADCFVSDACTNDPCLNGGTCTERNGQVHCLCLPTYAGDFCQTGELFSVVQVASVTYIPSEWRRCICFLSV